MKSDGTIVEVGDLSAGDVLSGYSLSGLSEDSDSNFLEWESDSLGETQKNVTVVNVTYSFSNKIYNINDGEIKGTSEHPMLVKDASSGKYKFKELVKEEVIKVIERIMSSRVENYDDDKLHDFLSYIQSKIFNLDTRIHKSWFHLHG